MRNANHKTATSRNEVRVANDEEMVDPTIVPVTMHDRENPMIKKHDTFVDKKIYRGDLRSFGGTKVNLTISVVYI